MKFEILLKEAINADKATVWQVISDTDHYKAWNPFVVKCRSSFEVGSPIIMHVNVFPGFAMRQKETILANRPGEYIEYGIKIPLNILSSSRQHIIKSTSDSSCRYDSIFRLEGLLAPVVGFLLGNRLRKGFIGMTMGIKDRAESLYQK